MRTSKEYTAILSLHNAGLNFCQIARETNIPRTTIRDYINNLDKPKRPNINDNILSQLKNSSSTCDELKKNYSYLLGMFLGDGCLTACKKNVWRLRITLDAKYPNIIVKVKECVEAIMQDNKVSIVDRPHNGKPSCVDVSCYSKDFVKLFPFYKPGPKWKYNLQLEEWQQSIIELYPKDFWLGLYHSDGSRYLQTNANKYYYNFGQKSEEITKLFTWCSDLLNLKYGSYKHKSGVNRIQFYNKDSILLLDSFAGPKT